MPVHTVAEAPNRIRNHANRQTDRQTDSLRVFLALMVCCGKYLVSVAGRISFERDFLALLCAFSIDSTTIVGWICVGKVKLVLVHVFLCYVSSSVSNLGDDARIGWG